MIGKFYLNIIRTALVFLFFAWVFFPATTDAALLVPTGDSPLQPIPQDVEPNLKENIISNPEFSPTQDAVSESGSGKNPSQDGESSTDAVGSPDDSKADGSSGRNFILLVWIFAALIAGGLIFWAFWQVRSSRRN